MPPRARSNVVTFLAGADVALSVSMTLTSTALGVFMTPFLSSALAGTLVPVDPAALFRDIVAVVIVPILLGIGLKAAAPRAVGRVARVAPPVATVVISMITAR